PRAGRVGRTAGGREQRTRPPLGRGTRLARPTATTRWGRAGVLAQGLAGVPAHGPGGTASRRRGRRTGHDRQRGVAGPLARTGAPAAIGGGASGAVIPEKV